MGAVFTPLTPGWEHSEDPLPGRDFLGCHFSDPGQACDWGHQDQSVSQDCPPLGQDAQACYFSGDTCDTQDFREEGYFNLRF